MKDGMRAITRAGICALMLGAALGVAACGSGSQQKASTGGGATHAADRSTAKARGLTPATVDCLNGQLSRVAGLKPESEASLEAGSQVSADQNDRRSLFGVLLNLDHLATGQSYGLKPASGAIFEGRITRGGNPYSDDASVGYSIELLQLKPFEQARLARDQQLFELSGDYVADNWNSGGTLLDRATKLMRAGSLFASITTQDGKPMPALEAAVTKCAPSLAPSSAETTNASGAGDLVAVQSCLAKAGVKPQPNLLASNSNDELDWYRTLEQTAADSNAWPGLLMSWSLSVSGHPVEALLMGGLPSDADLANATNNVASDIKQRLSAMKRDQANGDLSNASQLDPDVTDARAESNVVYLARSGKVPADTSSADACFAQIVG